MANFDFMEFTGGRCREFVAHAQKYSKEEAIQIMRDETGCNEEADPESVQNRWCRYYVRAPDFCDFDGDGGCYTYCDEGERGAFPVWVVEY